MRLPEAPEELVALHPTDRTGSTVRDIEYIYTTVEDLLAADPEPYDVVIASEVIEHVANPSVFVENLGLATR
eukprot:gene22632-9087_t